MDYLLKLKALEAAATKGPWGLQTDADPTGWSDTYITSGEATVGGACGCCGGFGGSNPADAEWLAEMFRAIPWLVGMVEEARELMMDPSHNPHADLCDWLARLAQGPPERGK